MKEKHILQWHITHTCNLRCKHCYQEDYVQDLKIEELEKILDNYIEFLKLKNFKGHINFTGGEPLSNGCKAKLYELMKICDENNITYGILTNGTLLNEKIIEELKQHKGLKFVQMSLEGTPKVNDKIRGKGTFNKVMKAVKMLNNANIETMISFTIHEGNFKELRKLIWICRLHRVKRFWTDRFVPIGGAEECEIKPISTTNFVKSMTVLGQEYRLNLLGTRVHANRAMQFMSGCGEFYECAAGKNLLTILADGTVLPCRRLPLKVGNALEDTLYYIYSRNNTMKQLIDSENNACITCGLYGKCKGGAKCLTYAVTGSLNNKDVNCIF